MKLLRNGRLWKGGYFRDKELSVKDTASVYEAYIKDLLEGNAAYSTGSDELGKIIIEEDEMYYKDYEG